MGILQVIKKDSMIWHQVLHSISWGDFLNKIVHSHDGKLKSESAQGEEIPRTSQKKTNQTMVNN